MTYKNGNYEVILAGNVVTTTYNGLLYQIYEVNPDYAVENFNQICEALDEHVVFENANQAAER